MQNERPYKSGDSIGDGFVLSMTEARAANAGYDEGRKSVEKDFNELLELANKMTHELPGVTTSELEFIAWKKARGIE